MSKDKVKVKVESTAVSKKRTHKERPVVESEGDEDNSDHDNVWKEKNVEEIGNLDSEIKMLERNLGIRTDAKRKKRFFSSIEKEGLGLGIFDFLDGIDDKVKMDAEDYQVPADEYKFNNPDYEVAIGESDLEDGAPVVKAVDPRDSDSDEA